MAQQHQECPHGRPVHECEKCEKLLRILENIRNGQKTISRDVLQGILRNMLGNNNYIIRRTVSDRISITPELRGIFVRYLNSFSNSYPTNRLNIARTIINYINTRNAIALSLRGKVPNNIKRNINNKTNIN